LLPHLTCKQLHEALAYDDIEPSGHHRLEAKLAEIQLFLYNRYRDPDSRPEPYSIHDFVPWLEKPPEMPPMSPEEAQALIDREVFGL
jgi:hypothetical protein